MESTRTQKLEQKSTTHVNEYVRCGPDTNICLRSFHDGFGDLLWGDKGRAWGSLVGEGVSVREVAVVDVLTHSSEDKLG